MFVPEKDKKSKILSILKNFPIKIIRVGVKNGDGWVTVNTHFFGLMVISSLFYIDHGKGNICTIHTSIP